VATMAQSLRLTEVTLTPMLVRPNLVANFSFEDVQTDGMPTGWVWDKRNTDATCTVDETQAHSGKRSLKFTNGTPFGAHVYGTLWTAKPIKLKPNKPYTLSAYIKSDDPAIAWVGGGHDWQFRLHFPPTGGKWRRVWMTFTPSEQDAEFVLRVVTESPTKGFWLDDVKLEEGNEPTICEPADEQWLFEPLHSEQLIEGDGVFEIVFNLFAPKSVPKLSVNGSMEFASMVAVMGGMPFPPLPSPVKRTISLERGAWNLVVTGEAREVDEIPRVMEVLLLIGTKPIARADTVVFYYSPSNAQKRLSRLREKLNEFKRLLDEVRAKGYDIAYPLVTFTVLENFINYAEEDLRHQVAKGWQWWINQNADARCDLDNKVAHSGRYSVRLTNRTPLQPHVYGTFHLTQPVKLQAGKPYTLSAWVKSDDPGTAWMGGGSNWQFRCYFKPTGGKWQQFTLTFVPSEADTDFVVRFNTDSETEGIWIDDVALVEGEQPDPKKPNLIFNPSFELVRSEVIRAFMQINDMEEMARRLERQINNAFRQPVPRPSSLVPFFEVPRWTGTQRPKISGPSFIAPVTFPSRPSSPVPRPVFFVGYGHFGQVRADIEKFPRYGTNIIQIEFGPSSVFPREGVVSDAPIRETLAVLDRAAKAGVAVNLLISPHYFPQWMLEKYPHLRKRREGFLQYCIHAPESQELLKRYIATIIPPLKDHPALHSICLTNEPVNVEEPCEFALRDWHNWLRNRHGDIQTLNQRWGTNFRHFPEIPLPNPFDLSHVPRPMFLDFVRFNQEWFANWHKMLADAIKAIAPDLPVHAKGMTWTMVNDPDVRYGVDAELFASFSDINGNDSANMYAHGKGEFAQDWLLNAMAFDLQRSVKDAPVFNSENHIIADRETRYIPPEHVRAVLWQGAIHGQSATTIWVWERTFDPKSDFAGSIMHRPACTEAVGLTCLDLNRLAEEVTALQKAPAHVALLHSVSSLVWDGGRYTDCRNKLYTALTFTGVKIGFVTERQLEHGIVPDVPVLFVPNIVHISDAAFETLKRYKGRIVLVGNSDLLSRNEYDERRNERRGAQDSWERMAFEYGKTTWRDLWQVLLTKLKYLGVKPLVEVRSETEEPIWGIAWRCAETTNGIIVNLCNYRHDTVKVTLWHNEKPIGGTDLLNNEKSSGSFTLLPLQIRLVQVSIK